MISHVVEEISSSMAWRADCVRRLIPVEQRFVHVAESLSSLSNVTSWDREIT